MRYPRSSFPSKIFDGLAFIGMAVSDGNALLPDN